MFKKKQEPENMSEISLARRKLARAQALFDSATDASFDYANSELTAAMEYLEYITGKSRVQMQDGMTPGRDLWQSA